MFNHFKKRHLIWIALGALGTSALVGSSVALSAIQEVNKINNINNNIAYRSPRLGETIVASNKNINDESFNNMSAKQFAKEQTIRDYVFANIGKFFTNIPNNLNSSNIVIGTPTISSDKSQVTVMIQLNKFIDFTGAVVEGSWGDVFTFGTFIGTGLTTSLKLRNININETNDINFTLLATEYQNNLSNPDVVERIKNSGIIINLPPNVNLQTIDILIQNPTDASDVNGSIVVDIFIINNKAWNDGEILPSMNLGKLTITGFRKLSPDITEQKVHKINYDESLSVNIWSSIDGNKFFAIDWFDVSTKPEQDNEYIKALRNYLKNNINKFIKQPTINGIQVTLNTSPEAILMEKSQRTPNAIDFHIKFDNCITSAYSNVGTTKTFTYTVQLKETPIIQWNDIYTQYKINELYKKLEGKYGVNLLAEAAIDMAENITQYLTDYRNSLPNTFLGASINSDLIFPHLKIEDGLMFVDTNYNLLKFGNIIVSFEGFVYQLQNNEVEFTNSNSIGWAPFAIFGGIVITLSIILIFIVRFYFRNRRTMREFGEL